MYNYQTISEKLKEKGIKTYDVETGSDFVSTGICFLRYEDFLEFITDNSINTVFIYEQYIDIEDYIITRETFRNADISEYKAEAIMPLVEAYNEELIEEELEAPKYVFAIAIWNNQKFYYIFQNEILFKGETLLEPEEKLIELVEDNINRIENANKAKEEAIEEQIKQIREFIIQDKEFRKCTNKQRRYDYLRNLLNTNKKYAVLKQHWISNIVLSMNGRYFIDDIWQELKAEHRV